MPQMNAAWSHTHPTYQLLIDGQTRAKIEPRYRQFLLTIHLHNRDVFKILPSVQKLMDYAEKELSALTELSKWGLSVMDFNVNNGAIFSK